jgi:hypothetical protein
LPPNSRISRDPGRETFSTELWRCITISAAAADDATPAPPALPPNAAAAVVLSASLIAEDLLKV